MANLSSFGNGDKLPGEHEKQRKSLAICHDQKQENRNVIVTSGGIESPPGAESDVCKEPARTSWKRGHAGGGVGN